MANGIRTGDPRGFNKGRISRFREGSRVRQIYEEGRRIYRPKRYVNNNKDGHNSPKTLNDKKSVTPVLEIYVVWNNFIAITPWSDRISFGRVKYITETEIGRVKYFCLELFIFVLGG